MERKSHPMPPFYWKRRALMSPTLKKNLRRCALGACCLVILICAGMLLRDEVLGRLEAKKNLRLQGLDQKIPTF